VKEYADEQERIKDRLLTLRLYLSSLQSIRSAE